MVSFVHRYAWSREISVGGAERLNGRLAYYLHRPGWRTDVPHRRDLLACRCSRSGKELVGAGHGCHV